MYHEMMSGYNLSLPDIVGAPEVLGCVRYLSLQD